MHFFFDPNSDVASVHDFLPQVSDTAIQTHPARCTPTDGHALSSTALRPRWRPPQIKSCHVKKSHCIAWRGMGMTWHGPGLTSCIISHLAKTGNSGSSSSDLPIDQAAPGNASHAHEIDSRTAMQCNANHQRMHGKHHPSDKRVIVPGLACPERYAEHTPVLSAAGDTGIPCRERGSSTRFHCGMEE